MWSWGRVPSSFFMHVRSACPVARVFSPHVLQLGNFCRAKICTQLFIFILCHICVYKKPKTRTQKPGNGSIQLKNINSNWKVSVLIMRAAGLGT